MASTLVDNSYGKSRVRLTKITRKADRHELKEMSVNIQLHGEFEPSYTQGDNSSIIATDTMKNTVYGLGAKHPIDTIESFAKHLAEHFLSRNKQVTAASIEIVEDRWERVDSDGKPHPYTFVGGSKEKRVTHVDCLPSSTTVESGIEDLTVLKTTDSEFSGFLRDEFTTLPDLKDRIFATSITAYWLYKSVDCDFDKTYETARRTLISVFAEHHSLSVQQTMFAIGDKVLEACPDIEEIHITMPNQHRLPCDLSHYGLPDSNDIFVLTDEPYGVISGTMSRSTTSRSSGKPAELSAKR